MIPVSLNLSNFTSYGENPPELDFTKFKLAAISGLNGAGKSSLLDAITWCIWGTSRAGDSADELIHLGSEKMQVQFIFELDGHLFTVKRQRIKKGGGSTSLELWSNSHNLTEGTIKATQQKIIDTLHLNFETFTNSAYLRQGHADEFTTKGPSDRKRILADILGLNQYDLLEEKAKEKSKEAQTKLSALEYQLIEIEAEISLKDEREKKLSQIQQEERQIKQQLQEVEEKIKSIEKKRQEVHTTVKQMEQQKEVFLQFKKELMQLQTQIELKKQAQKEYQEILLQKEQIEENYQKLLKYQEQKKILDSKRTELIAVKDELVVLEKNINDRESKRKDAIAKLEVQIKQFQTKVDNLEEQNRKLKENKNLCPTCNQLIDKEKNIEIFQDNLKQIEENKQQINPLSATVQKYRSIVLPEYEKAKKLQLQIQTLGFGI
ncbi:MAG: SMC family ATPase, partial [Patescibacteria group bacterium]|nr:SMC family ATPase [Patescibacteria group bacterium]